ncbi:MAG: hypothetical protein L6W00_21850 [Lentisphaeria bacterium]|nr:MAG: hypothetical protein L6W00_21850 [Lentisphaeria bacterium]
MLSLKAAESIQYLPELLTKLNADGFIFMHSSLTEDTALALSHAHIPFVSFNRLDLDCVSWVDYDNTGSLAETLDFLLASGYRRIAHIDFKVDFGSFQSELRRIYREKLEAAGCFDERLFIARDTRHDMRRQYGQPFSGSGEPEGGRISAGAAGTAGCDHHPQFFRRGSARRVRQARHRSGETFSTAFHPGGYSGLSGAFSRAAFSISGKGAGRI